jgi:polar amino acid transport system substrate-binding protein
MKYFEGEGMTKIKIMFLGFVCMVMSFNSFAKETISITSGEFLPDYSEKLKFYGLMPHIVTESFALAGIDTNWMFLPWARAKKLVKHGKFDASCCWAKSEERQKHFLYSDPVQSRTYVLFHLKSTKFDWNEIEDLQGIDIGATIGYTYGKEFNDAEKKGKLRVERGVSDNINIQKLLNGRIKVFASIKEVVYATIAEFGLDEEQLMTYHKKPLYNYQIHVIASKENKNAPDFLMNFNEGLKKLKSNGNYDQYILEAKRGDYIPKPQ